LPAKRLDVKRSTFVYYNEIYKPHIENAEIRKKLLSEIGDGDVNLWKLEIEGKRTPNKKPLSTRRKSMGLDVLCQILRLAKRRGLTNDKLLIDVRPFKNEENEDEVDPFTEDEVEGLLKASQGLERSLLAVCFFTGMRHEEILGLRWSGVFFDRNDPARREFAWCESGPLRPAPNARHHPRFPMSKVRGAPSVTCPVACPARWQRGAARGGNDHSALMMASVQIR
jgi:integrase